jgi:protein-disulfide isomerase
MSSGLLVSVLIGGLGIGGAVGYMAGAATKTPASTASTASTSGSAEQGPWFSYEGQNYDVNSLPSSVQTSFYQADLEAFNQKQALVREFVVRLALAKEQKKFTAVDKLPPLEELLPAPAVTDDEAKKFFEQNKDRVPPGTTYDQLAGRIKEFVANEKRATSFNSTLQRLETEGKLKMLAKEPGSPSVTIPVDQYPSKGAASAPNVLVEVSDYLCPHCQEVHPEVKKLLDKMGDKLKVVQINFALRPTQLSGAIIEGAFCAQKQSPDAFWKYHDAAFSKSWGTFADAYDVAKAKPIAEQAGLNVKDWETCMASKEPKDWIQKTRDVVSGLGVTGTPAFFLNNRRLNLRSHTDLARAVESQLAGS